MKRTTIILALTFGVSAFPVLGQAQEEKERQPARPREAREDARIERAGQRPDNDRPSRGDASRMQRPGQFGPGPMWGGRGGVGGPQQRFAPGRQGFGPQQRFALGRRGIGPQGRGQAWNRPQMAPRQGASAPDVCPGCGRPLDLNMSPGGQQRGGQGFGPRQNFGPNQRGLGNGPQGRGPAFGPPPWANRGGNNEDMRSGPRGQNREMPAMPGRGFGPMRGGPGGPEGNFERPGAGQRPEGRGSANRPPMERDVDRDTR